MARRGRSGRRSDGDGDDLGWLDELRGAREPGDAASWTSGDAVPWAPGDAPPRTSGGGTAGTSRRAGERPVPGGVPPRAPGAERAGERPVPGGAPAAAPGPPTGGRLPAGTVAALRRGISRIAALRGIRAVRRRRTEAAADPAAPAGAPPPPPDDETPWRRPVRRSDPGPAPVRPAGAPGGYPGSAPGARPAAPAGEAAQPGEPAPAGHPPRPGQPPRAGHPPDPGEPARACHRAPADEAEHPGRQPRPGPAARPGPARPDPRAAGSLSARQVRTARRVRRLALGAVVAVLLGALPGYLLIREGVKDPVFGALDALAVPAWAAGHPVDAAAGSRWCVKTCRYRERIADSRRPTAQTDAAYRRALRLAGWRTVGAGCPHPADGRYSCWQRDEFVLDLWTRDAVCDLNAPGTPVPAPRSASPAAPGTRPTPGARSTPVAPDRRQADGLSGCPGSKVTIKVTNGIDPRWHR